MGTWGMIVVNQVGSSLNLSLALAPSFFIFSSLGIYFIFIFFKSTCMISQLICFQFEGRIVQETKLVLYF